MNSKGARQQSEDGPRLSSVSGAAVVRAGNVDPTATKRTLSYEEVSRRPGGRRNHAGGGRCSAGGLEECLVHRFGHRREGLHDRRDAGGLLFPQVRELIHGLQRKGSLVGMDIVELTPSRDLNDISAITVGQLVINFIGGGKKDLSTDGRR